MPASLKKIVLTESKKAAEKYTPNIRSSLRHSYRVCQDQETDVESSRSIMYDGKYVFGKLCEIVIDVQQLVLFFFSGKNII